MDARSSLALCRSRRRAQAAADRLFVCALRRAVRRRGGWLGLAECRERKRTALPQLHTRRVRHGRRRLGPPAEVGEERGRGPRLLLLLLLQLPLHVLLLLHVLRLRRRRRRRQVVRLRLRLRVVRRRRQRRRGHRRPEGGGRRDRGQRRGEAAREVVRLDREQPLLQRLALDLVRVRVRS